MAKISIIIPIHDMSDGDFFLWRNINSIMSQTFKDYEIIITKEGRMAENTNAGIKKSTGELIKILYLDDYLAHPKSLENIVNNFGEEDNWLATACLHQNGIDEPKAPHFPKYTDDIHLGVNKIGSPSVMTFRRAGILFFDERMSWTLDADLYKRYYDTYGLPKILDDLNVIIGVGDHQTTNLLTDDEKLHEYRLLSNKHI